MPYAVGALAALREIDPEMAVQLVVDLLGRPEYGARVENRSAGDRWASACFALPDGGYPYVEIHQFDEMVDAMTGQAEDLGIDVSFLPDSLVDWYPHTSEITLAEPVLLAVLGDSPRIWWDSVEGFALAESA